jgi:hypothetical protein
MSLDVECKRLSRPSTAQWNYNREYIENGIRRFDSLTHQYGKEVPSGMMIGYVIGMEPEEIRQEVNGHQTKLLPQNPELEFDFAADSPYQTEQRLRRRATVPETFKLIHIWVDLRRGQPGRADRIVSSAGSFVVLR